MGTLKIIPFDADQTVGSSTKIDSLPTSTNAAGKYYLYDHVYTEAGWPTDYNTFIDITEICQGIYDGVYGGFYIQIEDETLFAAIVE